MNAIGEMRENDSAADFTASQELLIDKVRHYRDRAVDLHRSLVASWILFLMAGAVALWFQFR